MKNYYFTITQTKEGKHFASVVKVSENENVLHALNIDGIKAANLCPTKAYAAALAEQFNTQYKNNGTYLFAQGGESIKKLFIETADYNTFIITNGKKAVLDKTFPDDGTVEDATNWDCSGVEGLKSIEDIAFEMSANIFDFNESEFESVTEVGTL